MEKNRIYIALGVLAALIVATFLAYRQPDAEPATANQDPWHRVDKAQVTKLVIQRPGENQQPIELEKRDGHWMMTRPAQGPADESTVNSAIDALAEMHVASTAATEASSHAELEVDDAHAFHVTLFHEGAQMLDVLVGKNLDGGTAVRVPSAAKVYRVDHSIRYAISKEAREWRDRSITHFERAHVRYVEWVNPHGTFHFDKNGETWTPVPPTPAIDRLDTARINQTVINLLDLRAVDFAAPGANTGITPESPRFTVNMDDNKTATLRVGSNANESEIYVQREGSDIVYTVGRSHGEELNPELSRFQAPAPAADAGTPEGGRPAAPPPGGAPMMMGGDGGIPPEVMEQIRRQMQQRGMQMPH